MATSSSLNTRALILPGVLGLGAVIAQVWFPPQVPVANEEATCPAVAARPALEADAREKQAVQAPTNAGTSPCDPHRPGSSCRL